MNSRPQRSVVTRIATMGLALTGLCPALHGCIDVQGGAVELSWSLEDYAGNTVKGCARNRVKQMRLWWEADATLRSATWPCGQDSAVTGFTLPEGNVFLSVEPVCEHGVPPMEGTFVAPAPVARVVHAGEVVTLNTVLVMVRNDCVNKNTEDELDGTDCICLLP
jgi:hypothetical protein